MLDRSMVSGLGWQIVLFIVTVMVTLRSSPNMHLQREHRLGAHHEGTSVYMFSPDSKRVLSIGFWHGIVRDSRGGRQDFRIDADPYNEMLWIADWSPDGNRIATITRHGTVMVWDARDGALLFERRTGVLSDTLEFAPDGRILLDAPNGALELWTPGGASVALEARSIHHARFSTDGRLATVGEHGLQIWDTRTGAELQHIVHDDGLQTMTWLPDGQIAATDMTGIVIWDLGSSAPRTIRSAERPWYVVPSPDGKTLYVNYYDAPFVRAYDSETGAVQRTFPLDADLAVMAVSRDGSELVTCDGPAGGLADKTVRTWDTRTGTLVRTFGKADESSGFALSPDGELLATSGSSEAQVWGMRDGKRHAFLGGHTAGITTVAFSPNGRMFATGSGRLLGRDYTVKLWDAETGVLLGSVEHASVVNSVSFSPDGKQLVTTSNDWTFSIWDVDTLELVRMSSHGCNVWTARYSPDGSSIVSASCDGTARVWNANTGGQRLKLAISDRGGMLDARFSPDGTTIATSDTFGDLRVWNAANGKLEFVTHVCDDWAQTVDFDRTGTRILVSCGSMSEVVDARTGRATRAFEAGNARWSPDQERVLASDDLHAIVFDTTTGNRIATMQVVDEWVHSFAITWTPDGKRVIAGDDQGRVTVWDASSGELVETADAKPGQIWGFTWDPGDASRLVIAGEDGDNQNASGALAVWRSRP